jgi:hypothetical protein
VSVNSIIVALEGNKTEIYVFLRNIQKKSPAYLKIKNNNHNNSDDPDMKDVCRQYKNCPMENIFVSASCVVFMKVVGNDNNVCQCFCKL